MPDQLSWAIAYLLCQCRGKDTATRLIFPRVAVSPCLCQVRAQCDPTPTFYTRSLHRHRVRVPIKHLADLVGSRALRRHPIDGADQFPKLRWRHVLTSSGPGQARNIFIDQRPAVIIRPGLQGALREVAV